MELSSDLVSKFVEVTNDATEIKNETTVYGTIVKYNGSDYVRLDGSDLLTPVSTTTNVEDGERVTVLIKNHTAIVTGNISSPAARTDEVKEIGDQISEFEIIIADKVSTSELETERGRIDDLVSDNILVKGRLDAAEANIGTLNADNATINGILEAHEGRFETIETNKLDASIADITYATITDLTATNAVINNLEADYGEFASLATENFSAIDASIKNLETDKLSATDADLKYANIDFANIGEAAIEKIFSDSGIIKDLIMSDGKVTGELVAVTIKGDLIEGGTIVADKLIIQGTDGLYYRLNTDGETIESKQTDYNSLNGKVIVAKSVTANKIAVDDLVAFGATIGGFNITEDSIYSGVKSTVGNTTRGVYFDNDGQMVFGDANNFVKFYKDTADNKYKLVIAANDILIGSSGKNVENAITDVENKAIVSSVEQFYLSNSHTTLIGGSWSNSQPDWTEGKYIWRRTFITYGNGKTEYTPSQNGVCITGNTGTTGPTGKGISKTEPYWYLSTSNTAQSGGSWVTPNPPAWVDGRYYWQKLKTTYTDNTTSETSPVCITGGKGATGATGTSVDSITTEYYISDSKTTQTGGSWSTSNPTWSRGKYLWIRNKIVYKNPASTEYTTPYCDSSWEAVNEIQIGAKNLIIRSTETADTWIDTSGNVSVKTEHSTSDYISIEPSTDYMFTKSESTVSDGGYFRYAWYDANRTYLGKSNHNSNEFLWTSPSNAYYIRISYPTDCLVKFERGNKATDWSPAPEDIENNVTSSFSSAIEKHDENIKLYITENVYSQSEVDELIGTLETNFSLESGAIVGTITKTEKRIDDLNKEFQDRFNELTKYIRFDFDGLEIGESNSPFKIVLDNDRYTMYVNGVEVLWLDPDGNSNIPELTVSKSFNLFGYIISQDSSGNVNCEYAGG